MDWQNSSNAQGWYAANYANMSYGVSYSQPPPNTVSTPCWGAYGSFPGYPQSQWGYPLPPNYNVPPPPLGTSQAPPPGATDGQPPINPPLPPDPPPSEPSKEIEESKESLKTVKANTIKDSSEVPPINQGNLTVPQNFGYQYPSMNWFTGNQQNTNKPSNNTDQLMTGSIKFNLKKKKDLTKDSIPGKDHSMNSPIAGKFNNTNSGKFNQMNFMKGQNLSVDKMDETVEGKGQNASELPKKPTNVLQSGDWPESLKRYVGKCFSRCLTELDKDQVEICLKGKLTQSAHSGSLWGKDWDKEPLINVHSQAIDSPIKKIENNNSNYSQSDLSRGFILKKRNADKSPVYDGSQHRQKRPTEDDSYIPLTKRGKIGKKWGKKRKNMMEIENDNPFYSKMGAKSNFAAEKEFGSSEKLEKRAARFAPADMPPPQAKKGIKQNRLGPKKKMNLMASINIAFSNEENIDWGSMHIVGTCTVLEKQFLRLTAAPDPSTVRTPATLKRALESAKTKWVDSHDYRYTCNQMKSIRQDLTIQGIRNKFTVKVYETHCRVALEKGDHEEFNQCQSQLKQLYAEIGGDNVMEFTAYRLLYYIFTKNTLDITSLIAGLSDKDKRNKTVAFALQVRAAWSLRNYYRFFCLYRTAPLMSGFLMDWFSERERKNAIKIIIKSYRPGTVNVDFVRSCLAVNSDDDWNKLVETCCIIFTDPSKKEIDCKTTVLAI